MQKYVIFSSPSIEDLGTKVNSFLVKGDKLIGQPFIGTAMPEKPKPSDVPQQVFCQAMIIEVSEPPVDSRDKKDK